MKKLMVAVAVLASPLSAQQPPEPIVAPQPPGVVGAPSGTGGYPAIAESRADAPGYTIYRPARMPKARMPLVLWGNGGCRDNGLSASHFLREIASHGYFVVANGAPREERKVLDRLVPLNGPPPPPPGTPTSPPRRMPDQTSYQQLLAGIDWVKKSSFRRNVDSNRVAVMGHSCGGLQALAAGADPRIDAVMAFASGVYIRANTGVSGVNIVKDDLKKLHTPVAYILGGPTDIAYPNGSDYVERINHVPVFLGNQPVGHGGTFPLANGGEWAQVGVAWLDWQLKKDRKAGAQFTGPSCGLCTAKDWTVVRKQFPVKP